ncbi:hypothetical protein C5167_034814, partial [Papaver somniferum]
MEERNDINEEMRRMQRIMYENQILKRELDTLRKEIEKPEAQSDLNSKQLMVLSEEVTSLNIVQGQSEGVLENMNTGDNVQLQIEENQLRKELEEKDYELDSVCSLNRGMSTGDNAQLQTEADQLRKELEEKDYELDSVRTLNQTLIDKEHKSNRDLQEARKVLIERHNRANIGIKRMGELNAKPFRDACSQKFSPSEQETKFAELCSLWQKHIQNSEWYPFENVAINNNLH